MTRQTVLIAGATGVVGHAAMHEFAALPDIDLVVVSRRTPDLPAAPRARITHLALDLTDADACRAQLAGIGPVTQLVYGALYEKPGLVAGWRDPEQMSTNLAMLRNLLDPLAARGGLRHASILQGTKAYGVHLHPVPVPARENQPRDLHDNFYWLQEDHLRAQAAQHGFDFTIWRPQLIFGDVVGVAMNLMPVIGVYAALCRQQGLPFAYPGGQTNLLEAVDARLLARALRWAGDAPAARGQTFNITNGDVFAWRNVWPAIADALGVTPGDDERRSLAQWLPSQADAWQKLVVQHGLRNQPMPALLGESHHYADFCFGYYARSTPPPVLVSTIKLRQAGFGDCIDTEQMFRDGFARLQQMKVLPPR
jgi:nucleoside-diphosphate-sugar epimerase